MAIRIEKQNRKSGGPRNVYVFVCVCGQEFKCRTDSLKIASGKCVSCSHKKRPFESIYNSIRNDHRNLEVSITYEEYLATTANPCFYCGDKIERLEYGINNGVFLSRAYFLDRINNNVGYTKENCVACCFKCNRMKLNYTATDFIEHCKKIASNGVCGI